MIVPAKKATGLNRELLDALAKKQWTRYFAVLDQIQAQDRNNQIRS